MVTPQTFRMPEFGSRYLYETRGTGGSRRLQMRSSGLRSPFGVRNVLMLMDGFARTNASGNSPLELWNPQWLDRLEVVKGPVGAIRKCIRRCAHRLSPPLYSDSRMPSVGTRSCAVLVQVQWRLVDGVGVFSHPTPRPPSKPSRMCACFERCSWIPATRIQPPQPG